MYRVRLHNGILLSDYANQRSLVEEIQPALTLNGADGRFSCVKRYIWGDTEGRVVPGL